MASGGIAFTKAMQPTGFGVPPTISARADDVSVDEVYSSLPFTTTGTATAGDVAVISIVDSGLHWVEAAVSPSATAGTGVPLIGPITFCVTLFPGDKVSVAV